MAYPFSRLEVSIQAASGDGLYYGRFPHGDKPVLTSISGAAVSAVSAAGALSTAIRLGGAAADLSSASASLTTGSGGSPIVFDRFISTTGNDAHDGLTPATAWAITSLQDTNTNNSQLPGLKIGLMAGTYSLSGLQSGAHPGTADPNNNYPYPILHLPAGSAGASTYIASCDVSGNYSARVATLDWGAGVSATTNSVIGQDTGGNGYITIDGLTIKGYSAPPTGSSLSNKQIGYYPGGSAGPMVVKNCDMGVMNIGTTSTGSNDGSIFEDGANNTVVQNCFFHDIHKSQSDHVHAYCSFSSTGTQYIENTHENCDTALDGKVNANGCTIARNYFYNCGVAGGDAAVIQGFDGDQNTTNTPHSFLNNIFDSCPGEVRTVDVITHIAQPNTIANNTVYFTDSGSNGVWDLRCQTGGSISFHDNITVTTLATGGGSPQGRLGLTSGFVALSDFNCFFAANGNFNAMWALSGVAQNSLTAWHTTGLDTHSINTNPVFASTIVPGAGPAQFKLGSGSPCIGTGTSGVNMGAWDGTVTQIGCDFE